MVDAERNEVSLLELTDADYEPVASQKAVLKICGDCVIRLEWASLFA
jgi:hypothetical protein